MGCMIEALGEKTPVKDRETLGIELYQRARELIIKDRGVEGKVRYRLDGLAYLTIQDELQQLGEPLRHFINEPLVFISSGGRIRKRHHLEITLRLEPTVNGYEDSVLDVNSRGECQFRKTAGEWTRPAGESEIVPKREATENEIKGFQVILSHDLPQVELSL